MIFFSSSHKYCCFVFFVTIHRKGKSYLQEKINNETKKIPKCFLLLFESAVSLGIVMSNKFRAFTVKLSSCQGLFPNIDLTCHRYVMP